MAGKSTSRFKGLWRDRDFMKLWGAQSISQVGTQVSLLAIPVIAALTLDASAFEMGVVTAAETLPFLLFGLFAGVVADRVPRRPIMLWTDIGRGVLLGLIPVCHWLDLLTIPLLIAIAFLTGVMTVFFEVAYQSYLPVLVGREHLVEGNSKLETSRAGAQIAGPGIAGGLVEIVTAPFAVILDACSFLLSALFLARIKKDEPRPERSEEPRSVLHDIGEGVGYITRHPLLRPIAGCTATANFFGGMLAAVFVLFATTELGISPGLLGLIFAGASVGFLLGAIVARRTGEFIGVGPAIIASIAVSAPASLAIPLAPDNPVPATIILLSALFLTSFGAAIYNIIQVSLRQTITPDRLLGRMNATMRFLVWGTIPLGNLAGGLTGEVAGLRAALAVAAFGNLLAVLWPLLSAVRNLQEQPAPA